MIQMNFWCWSPKWLKGFRFCYFDIFDSKHFLIFSYPLINMPLPGNVPLQHREPLAGYRVPSEDSPKTPTPQNRRHPTDLLKPPWVIWTMVIMKWKVKLSYVNMVNVEEYITTNLLTYKFRFSSTWRILNLNLLLKP
jgi:hypothetical protein